MTELLVLFKSVFLFAVITVISFGQSLPEQDADKILRSGLSQLLKHDYETAFAKFDTLDKAYPELPLGKIYKAAHGILKNYDYAIINESDSVENYLDEALEIAEEYNDKHENSIWGKYFLALCGGYGAYFSALDGDFFSAVTDGVESLSYFAECLDINNYFYDAYIAIGSYKYWTGYYSQSLGFLPFLTDERAEGIDMLEAAVDKDSYNSYVAAHSLMWVYIKNNKSDKAVETGLKVLNKFPDNRFFRWTLARAYVDIDKAEAVNQYERVLNSYKKAEITSDYNIVVLSHKIAMLQKELNNFSVALQYCDFILKYEDNDELRSRLSERFGRVNTLKRWLLKHMETKQRID